MSELSHVGMTTCFYCGGGSEVLLDMRLRNVLPRNVGVVSMRPCSKCEDYMEKGVILIVFDEEKTDMEQIDRDQQRWLEEHKRNGGNVQRPGTELGKRYERDMRSCGLTPWEFIPSDVYRSGHFAVVRDEFIDCNITPEPLAQHILRARWAFMPAPIMQQICTPQTQENGN